MHSILIFLCNFFNVYKCGTIIKIQSAWKTFKIQFQLFFHFRFLKITCNLCEEIGTQNKILLKRGVCYYFLSISPQRIMYKKKYETVEGITRIEIQKQINLLLQKLQLVVFEFMTSQLTVDRFITQLLTNNKRLDLIELNSRSQLMTNMNFFMLVSSLKYYLYK